MKNFIVVLALVTSSLVALQAAAADAVERLEFASEQYGKYVQNGKMDNMLNPILCVNAGERLILAYSVDFRVQGKAFVVRANRIQTTNIKLLKVTAGETSYENGVNVEKMNLEGLDLTCVSSALQLESVPGAN